MDIYVDGMRYEATPYLDGYIIMINEFTKEARYVKQSEIDDGSFARSLYDELHGKEKHN